MGADKGPKPQPLLGLLSLVIPGAGHLARRRWLTGVLAFVAVVLCYGFFWMVFEDTYDSYDDAPTSWRWIPLQVWFTLGVGVAAHIAAAVDAMLHGRSSEKGPLVSRRAREEAAEADSTATPSEDGAPS